MNCLDIKDWLDIICKTIVSMIKEKTLHEIPKTFNIKKRFTEEEEAQYAQRTCVGKGTSKH